METEEITGYYAEKGDMESNEERCRWVKAMHGAKDGRELREVMTIYSDWLEENGEAGLAEVFRKCSQESDASLERALTYWKRGATQEQIEQANGVVREPASTLRDSDGD